MTIVNEAPYYRSCRGGFNTGYARYTTDEETEMPETPTFGRYAEISYEQMTTEQQEGYQFVKEVRGQVGGPSKIWIHNPKLAKAAAPLGAHFHPGH